jgi:hypothetical protein
LPPPEQPSENVPPVKLALMVVAPSVERKEKLPPAHAPVETAGQVSVSAPAGVATFDVM